MLVIKNFTLLFSTIVTMNLLTFLLPMFPDFMIVLAYMIIANLFLRTCYKLSSSMFLRERGPMKVNLFGSSYISILTSKLFSFFNTHNNKNNIKFPLYSTYVSREHYGSSLHVFKTKIYRFKIQAVLFKICYKLSAFNFWKWNLWVVLCFRKISRYHTE